MYNKLRGMCVRFRVASFFAAGTFARVIFKVSLVDLTDRLLW